MPQPEDDLSWMDDVPDARFMTDEEIADLPIFDLAEFHRLHDEAEKAYGDIPEDA